MELGVMMDAAHFFANSLNPLLAIAIVWTGITLRARFSVGKYWAACLLGIGAAVMLAEAGKHFLVWPGHPSFPSGHEAFAVSASTCLAMADRRLAYAAGPICVLLGWALAAVGYHHSLDILGAALAAPWPPLAVFRLLSPPPKARL